MSTWTVRKKVVDARTSATTGTAVITTLTELVGHNLDEFSELLVYLDVNTALAGSTPKMDIYLQRAVVEDPDPDTNGDWADYMAFPQLTTDTKEYWALLPIKPIATTTEMNFITDRQHAAMTAQRINPGFWGDRIRIVEKMSNTITTQAVYDITITGQLRVVN